MYSCFLKIREHFRCSYARVSLKRVSQIVEIIYAIIRPPLRCMRFSQQWIILEQTLQHIFFTRGSCSLTAWISNSNPETESFGSLEAFTLPPRHQVSLFSLSSVCFITSKFWSRLKYTLLASRQDLQYHRNWCSLNYARTLLSDRSTLRTLIYN